jgi:hypothetical protein
MKIRYRLAAIASVVALTGAAGLAGASAASAAPTPYFWCLYNNDNPCLSTNANGQPVGVASLGYGSGFLSFNGEHTDGNEYVEYYQIGTSDCLTDSGASLYLQTCAKGDARELWWWNGNGELVNHYATVHYGHPDCLNHIDGQAGSSIEACTAAAPQIWTQYPDIT